MMLPREFPPFDRLPAILIALALWGVPLVVRGETVGDRLWIWGHPAGVYNASYLRPLGRTSTIEPADAARQMGLRNIIFVRYDGLPPAPFDDYFRPFGKLDRVYWSLVAAGGATSQVDRDAAFALADRNENVVGFILDDFFHEPAAGNADEANPAARHWLAENSPAFPLVYTVTLPQPTACEAVELVQTEWPSGDYRAKSVAVEISPDGQAWQPAAEGSMANRPGAELRLALPVVRFTAIRVRFLDTHDTRGAMSVGLARLRLIAGGQIIDPSDWKAAATSTYPGFDPATAVAPADAPDPPFRAALAPAELRALRERRVRGRRLPIMAVVYTRQVKPGAKAHLAEVDEVCMWTWRPADLANLEANFAALEKLVPGKPIYLGCYMYDFHECRPMPVELMRRQTELGHRWLKAGRIRGMIFLATPNVDVGLEAVDWTREWVRTHSDETLEIVGKTPPPVAR